MTDNSVQKPGFFTFAGRARRREYWANVLKLYIILIGGGIAIGALAATAGVDSTVFVIAAIVYAVVAIACAIRMWPVTVRRLHDRNMSGWWLLWFFLLGFIPFVGWIVPWIQFVIVGCLCGTPGDNHFGPDPKASQAS